MSLQGILIIHTRMDLCNICNVADKMNGNNFPFSINITVKSIIHASLMKCTLKYVSLSLFCIIELEEIKPESVFMMVNI